MSHPFLPLKSQANNNDKSRQKSLTEKKTVNSLVNHMTDALVYTFPV